MKSFLTSVSITTLLCIGCASASAGPPESTDSSKTPAETRPRPATDGSELTVHRALEIALSNHPSLTVLLRRVGMAEGDAVQAGLWPNPEIEACRDQ